MTRPLEPRTGGLPPGTGAPVTLLAVVWGAVAVAGLLWLSGTAATWLSGQGWSPPPFSTASATRFLDGGPTALWPTSPPALVWMVAGVLLLPVWAIALGVWVATRRSRTTRSGLAGSHEVAALLPDTVRQRSRGLRAGLAHCADRDISGDDTGLALGSLTPRSPVLRASWEDVLLAIMAPRAGKTTSLAIPSVLAAPGAVVATSNKADLWAATATLRARDTGEAVWTFDPQGITGAARTWWWNPLAAVTSVEEAARLAGHFIQEIRGERGDRDFWTSAAHDLLTGLLLAAAVSGRDLRDVYSWLNDPVIPTPASLLRAAGHDAVAAALTGRQHGAPETRDGIYETARTATACLRDPRIMEWITPPTRGGNDATVAEFAASAFPTSRQTLYLLSKDGAGAAAPLVAAFTDRVMRDGVQAAEQRGGRLDPPAVVVLDEAANVCRIADLPDLYSHLGSRGVVPLTILQSYRQGVRVWGEAGMDTLWSAATVKLLGAGMDDARVVEDVSRLIGDHDVAIRSFSDGDRSRSTSTSLRRQRVLPPEDIRALPRGMALLMATGTRVALLHLRPSYSGPRRGEIAEAVAGASSSSRRASVMRPAY